MNRRSGIGPTHFDVEAVSEQGKEAVVALHGNGDFFGERTAPTLATVATMTDCVIMRVEKSAMVQVLHGQSSFSDMFMSYLLTGDARVEEDLVDQLFNASENVWQEFSS